MILLELDPEAFEEVLLPKQNIHSQAFGEGHRRGDDHVGMPHFHLNRGQKAIDPAVTNAQEILFCRTFEVNAEIPSVLDIHEGRIGTGIDQAKRVDGAVFADEFELNERTLGKFAFGVGREGCRVLKLHERALGA